MEKLLGITPEPGPTSPVSIHNGKWSYYGTPVGQLDMPRFIRCASHLTRDTGNDLDAVGLSSEYNNTSISIYGDYDNGHELIISEFVIKVGGEWTEVNPTDTQRAALAAILAKEVENVRQIRDEDKAR